VKSDPYYTRPPFTKRIRLTLFLLRQSSLKANTSPKSFNL
jgi:hypothetical protein